MIMEFIVNVNVLTVFFFALSALRVSPFEGLGTSPCTFFLFTLFTGTKNEQK